MSYLHAALLLALFVGVLLWALGRHGREVIEERVLALDISDAHKRAALACFNAAARQRPAWRRLVDHALARIVLWPVVKRLPWDAETLPAKYADWDNNAGLNGDGECVLRAGKWVNLRDIGWRCEPGEVVVRYSDPEYDGDAYYCSGHHPRSAKARYAWLTRNVKSGKAVADGIEARQRPQVLAGSEPMVDGTPQLGAAQAGFMLLWDGAGAYQWRSTDRAGPICVWRNVGYKLDIVRNSPSGTGRAAVVGTWVSFRRWKGGRG